MSKKLAPGWQRSTLGKLPDQLDGEHDQCVVGAAVNMGLEGFSDASIEESTELADANYGPMMLAAYNHLSGIGLLQAVRTAHRLVCNPDHDSRAAGGTGHKGQQQRFYHLARTHKAWLTDWLAECFARVLMDMHPEQNAKWWRDAQRADEQDQQPDLSYAALNYLFNQVRLVLPGEIEQVKQEERERVIEAIRAAGSLEAYEANQQEQNGHA